MKRIYLGFEKGLPTLALVITVSSLVGCVKTDSAVKTGQSGNGVDDLFLPLSGKTPSEPDGEIGKYALQIHTAVQSNFHDADSYTGKQCDLRIKLDPDGMLLDVQALYGDPALCGAAIKATANTSFPKPRSQAVYSVFKNTVLDFRP
jgi:colicin import membrane protein